MKKRFGFTLIELLAVIVILGIILVIAIPNILDIISNSKNKVYKEYENTLAETTKKYMVENIKILPKQIGEKKRVKLSELQTNDYITNLINPNKQDETCNGYVLIGKESTSQYSYNGYIKCGNDYITNGYTDLLRVSFGGTDKDVFREVVKVTDGYVVVGGSASYDYDLTEITTGTYSYDAVIIKYGFDGKIIWQKSFGGSEDEEFQSMIAVSDGFIAVGYSYSNDMALTGLYKGSSDAIIVKYDLNGNVIWKKTFGGTGNDNFLKIKSISDGFIVIGESSSNDQDLSGLNKGSWDAIIVKYDLSGNVIWKKTFGGTGWDTYYAITNQSDGYVVVGKGGSNTGDLTGLSSNGSIIVKYDLNGNVLWKKTYGSGSIYNYFRGVENTPDNGVIAVGSSDSTTGDLAGLNKGDEDATIVKYDSSGNIVWKKNYGGTKYDWFESIISTTGGYIIIGNSTSTDGDLSNLINKGQNDAIIVKYDLDGNVLYEQNYGGNDDDYFNDIIEANNIFIVVGKSWSDNDDMNDISKGWYDATLFTVD